jgi:glutathione S-transferase
MISRMHDLHFEPALRTLYPLVQPRAQQDTAAIQAAVEVLQQRLDQLEALLAQADGVTAQAGPYAVGASLTLADCGFMPAFL